MNWLKTFFSSIWRATTDTTYYRELKSKTFWQTARYLYSLFVLTAFVSALMFAVLFTRILPFIPQYAENLKTALRDLYPKELVVTIENGKVSTNVKEPYTIDLPTRWRLGDEGEPAHLLTFDTKGNTDAFERYDSYVLLTETSVVVRERERGSIKGFRVYKIPDDMERFMNYEKYESGLKRILPLLDYLRPIAIVFVVLGVVVLPFIGAFIAVLFMLLYLLLACLLLLLIAWIRRIPLTYQQLYRLSLAGLTPAILYQQFIEPLFGFHVPFGFSIIFLGWMAYVMGEFKHGARGRGEE